ncbi:MAG: YgiT-type zinc finger protein [Actinomycetota bacterium]|nr:YgiT-type zinc finger protein [Actinomycetota bacterium]
MRCERCDQGERRPIKRAKLAERDGRVAVVLDVPMEECPACGDRWLDWDIAKRLDSLLTEMLASDIEVATRHFSAGDLPAA